MSGDTDPALVTGRPLLHWLDEAFVAWPWRLAPGCLAAGIPPRTMSPSGLRRWLLADTTDYPTRDRTWAQIVTLARPDTSEGRSFRLLAIGLAGYGLRNYHRRIHVRTSADLPDLHADIVTGFLTRLAVIDPHSRNLAGRLIDSAIGYAARRYHHQQTRPVPAEALAIPFHPDALDLSADGHRDGACAGHDDGDSEGLGHVLRRVAAHAGRVGAPIPARDLELIAATRLHRQPLPEVAARLGIGVQAAYKRRQRAEQRLSVILGHTP